MKFPDDFDPARCVLFLGSGFSASATNKRSERPPVGNALRDKILEELGSDQEEIELKDVASYAVSQGIDLYNLLHELFTITAISEDQKTVLEKKWRRIYTTNYDDTVEFFEKCTNRRPKRYSYSIEDARPRKFSANSVVHLHGYIHLCTKREVLSQLVLDHRSYAEQAALDSPWWDQFERDILGAQWIFFVGYNLNDFTVAKYLTKNHHISDKTRFILRPNISQYMADRLVGFGIVDTIELSGFANICASVKDGVPIQEFRQLKSFEYIDPYKDNKSVMQPTPVEIEAFLTRGNYNFQSLSSTYPKGGFALPRAEKMKEARNCVKDARTVILHSRTANGKSVFADMLSLDLSSIGKQCVRYVSHSDIAPSEISFLSQIENLVVFLRTYDDIVEITEELKELRDDTKFIIEINTGTDQVRRTEVHEHLQSPIRRIDLNPFDKNDRNDLHNLLSHAGIPASALNLRAESRTELRDHLIDLLNSTYVKDRLDAAIRPLLEDRKATEVIVTACILRAFSVHVGMDFIRAVIGGDPFDILLKNEVAVLEFGALAPEELALHSATFSEFFLKKYVGGTGITSIIHKLALEAARRKNSSDRLQSQRSREARKALGVLMQYGKVSNLLNGTFDAQKNIYELYEHLRESITINDEPLFWLQYSIFMKDTLNYKMARNHLETAYERASKIDVFKTYQLDTNYLKLILQAPRNEEGYPGDTEILFDLIDKVRAMVTSADHRGHAIRVLEDLKGFCLTHGEKLTEGERKRLSIQCLGIVRDLDNLDTQIKTELGTEIAKLSVQEAVSVLARLP